MRRELVAMLKLAGPVVLAEIGWMSMLILYADGDEKWRRDQNVEAAKALLAAGNSHVQIVQIAGRTHNSIWSRISDANDETAERIVTFARALAPS